VDVHATKAAMGRTVPNRAAALRLARRMGCEGAHEMPGGGWAPCPTHDAMLATARDGAEGFAKWKAAQGRDGERERGVAGIETMPGGGMVSAKSVLQREAERYMNVQARYATLDLASSALTAQMSKAGNSQSTPAKPSERISGSEANAAGSAGSRTAARKIELTPELVAALEKKVADHNEAMRARSAAAHRMATLPMLKAVLRRGMGAYSVSHRPEVSSRQQWGMARVNAFLKLLASGKPSDAKYVSDNDLLPKGHERATGRS